MKGLLILIVDILKVPSILVGLIAMIGLLVQKKPFTDIVKGTIKTILGFLVLGGGAGLVVNSLAPMGSMFEQGFHVQGIVPNNEAIVSNGIKRVWYSNSTNNGSWNVLEHIYCKIYEIKIYFPDRTPYFVYGMYDWNNIKSWRI